MRRLLVGLIALSLSLCAVACGSDDPNQDPADETSVDPPQDEPLPYTGEEDNGPTPPPANPFDHCVASVCNAPDRGEAVSNPPWDKTHDPGVVVRDPAALTQSAPARTFSR